TMDGRIGSIHPGHGPAYETPLDALEAIEQAIAHRRERIEEVRRARTAGVLTMDRLLRVVYGPDLPEQLEGAARWNLRATLDHLAEERGRGPSGPAPPVRCGAGPAADAPRHDARMRRDPRFRPLVKESGVSPCVSRRASRQRARRRRRSTSEISTARASSRIQPREAKSARALLTVSREAPTSWASSSWVRPWATITPSSVWRPKRCAR